MNKRPCIGTSSKNLDAEAVGEPKTASQPCAGGDPSRSKLLTVGNPVGEFNRARSGGFLNQCGYCKRQIPSNSDIFMYGDLCGFCSAECRDKQMERDQSAKAKQRANAKLK
ncbi:FCS-Like Zinc finger 6-like [Salvia miltiorrhiza]|uniref:FCS-Like Zinc finger 6-like n=1 Tax=Salvia miltiorrhiza TaxID=226208 RepID=UPI0025ACCBBC|nr:FCS-Like Zinc finger 6-like [Salvia miltiorrhiza]